MKPLGISSCFTNQESETSATDDVSRAILVVQSDEKMAEGNIIVKGMLKLLDELKSNMNLT